MSNDYQQEIRNAIYTRESEGRAIYEVAETIEKILRKQWALESEAENE